MTDIGQAGDGDESFNGELRNELLNGEYLYTLREAQVVIENWRQHYKRIRPYSALGYRPPAPETTGVRLTAESRIGETRNAAYSDIRYGPKETGRSVNRHRRMTRMWPSRLDDGPGANSAIPP